MKKNLRKEFIKQRNELEEKYRLSATKKIFEQIENLEVFKKARSIFVYVGFGSEILTEAFIKKHIDDKDIYVPKIKNKTMNLVKIESWEELEVGHFGVLEPKSDNYYKGDIDVVITPSIVFATDGYRLGYGKGYYDNYFSRKKYGISVGVSYAKLLQKSVPTEVHDVAVNILVTEDGVIDVK